MRLSLTVFVVVFQRYVSSSENVSLNGDSSPDLFDAGASLC